MSGAVLERLAQLESDFAHHRTAVMEQLDQLKGELDRKFAVRRVLVKDVIEALEEALVEVRTDALEEAYQTAFQEKLKTIGVNWERPRVPDPDLGGYGVVDLYKSALDLSDIVRCNRLRAASLMVWRCVADLKPGVFDAPLRGCGA
jgi:hypothetical protein